MDEHAATELAFKNGYKEGKQEVAREIFEELKRKIVFTPNAEFELAQIEKKYTEDKT